MDTNPSVLRAGHTMDMAVVHVGTVHGEVICRKEDEGDTEGG